MATPKSQRIAILAIVVLMVVSTIGMFAAMVLGEKNSRADASKLQEATAKYQKDQEAYETKVKAQSAELSKRYYPVFSPYLDRVAAYDRDSVSELKAEDLLVGAGEEVKGDTVFSAYYVGWNPDGKIFDQSVENNALKASIPIAAGLDKATLIEGWKEGLKGMKIGGVRLLEIPSYKAYGEQGSGTDDIPPNTPLKFLVMAVKAPEAIPQPEIPAELLQQYQQQGLGL